MIFLSNNHSSVDDQTADVISYLSNGTDEQQRLMAEFTVEFPEYNSLEWHSWSHPDLELAGLDPDYMSWVRDWLDNHTSVVWIDSEPVILEEEDDMEPNGNGGWL